MVDNQVDIFSEGKSQSEVFIDAAKDILLKHGYRILDPIVINDKITTVRHLRDYFYKRLDSKYPNRQRKNAPNIKMDMKIVSDFVASQMHGASKERAIQECIEIVDTLFDQEEDFRFKYPLDGIGVLGQGKLAWITVKAIELLNKKRCAEKSKEINEKAEAIENDTEIDVDDRLSMLDAMLEKMEANNG